MTTSRRYGAAIRAERSVVTSDGPSFSEAELEAIERAHPDGLSVQQLVEVYARRGARLTEATFRKYVQLGLLPRSVRVGRKGKHRGSLGLYPASAVRQLEHIRKLMSQGFTMEEIQREFLFVRGDIEALERQLDRVYAAFETAFSAEGRAADEIAARALVEARSTGASLVRQLEEIEHRMTLRARMERAAL